MEQQQPPFTWFILPEDLPRSNRLFIDSDDDSVLSGDLGREGDLDGALPLQRRRFHHVRDLSLACDGCDSTMEDIRHL